MKLAEYFFNPLFKLDKGRVRIWRVAIVTTGTFDKKSEEAFNPVVSKSLKMYFGLFLGKRTDKVRPVVGKNIGKSNETTPEKQALLEAESEYLSQKDKGYVSLPDLGVEYVWIENVGAHYMYEGVKYIPVRRVINELLLKLLSPLKMDATGRIKPMILHHGRLPSYTKGSKMYKKSKEIKFPCILQPKIDGVCALVDNAVGLTTRGGKDRLTPGGDSWNDICPIIVNAVKALNLDYILHGEMYIPGETLQEITKANKKAYPKSILMELHVFDVAIPDMEQSARIRELVRLQEKIDIAELNAYIKVVPSMRAMNMDDLLKFENVCLQSGYEGIVVRHNSGMYEAGVRSKDVLKIVRFDSCEVLLLDIVPMVKEPSQGLFVVRYSFTTKPNNLSGYKDFSLTPSCFTHDERVEMLANKEGYIGKYVTIEHRGFTDANVPRIATAKAFREEGT
ncbi:MAG: hypothetical protein COA82_03395 [Alkaliphilus sp.]|nr:MAG: hypothetical protein COA82_03395 [Alkaliphilus sp.]